MAARARRRARRRGSRWRRDSRRFAGAAATSSCRSARATRRRRCPSPIIRSSNHSLRGSHAKVVHRSCEAAKVDGQYTHPAVQKSVAVQWSSQPHRQNRLTKAVVLEEIVDERCSKLYAVLFEVRSKRFLDSPSRRQHDWTPRLVECEKSLLWRRVREW